MKKVAIFASGTGSNAQQIHKYSLTSDAFEVGCILSNRSNAKVLDYAAEHHIPTLVFNKSEFYNTRNVDDFLVDAQIDLVVLAGFLWLIPTRLVDLYPKRIVNIHPSLLPKYGGKGMYGHHVHEAVNNNDELESGITIHFVNQHYDEGRYIFQTKTKLSKEDNPDRIGEKVLRLEHYFFPRVVNGVCKKL